MKYNIKVLFISMVSLLTMGSCTKYLDVVPDGTLKLEDIFGLRESAMDALAKVYSYMPNDDLTHGSSWLLGDEWSARLDLENNLHHIRGIRVMRGLQSVTSPQLGLWSGTQGGKPMYEGIRQADVFLDNVWRVRDLSDDERRSWVAQVKFLKAYYVFLLVRQYGPIVLPEKMASPESTKEELFRPRATVEESFDYIVKLMDEAIPDLRIRAGDNELGQVDQIAARGIKSRVLLYRASPFFNGNVEYFGDFTRKTDGKQYFSLNADKEKWKNALDAINEAIELAEGNGARLFTYTKEPFLYDKEAFEENPEQMKVLYDLRMLIVEPWNRELLWGMSGIAYTDGGALSTATQIRLPPGYGDGVVNSNSFAWQWLGASYATAERYYSKNGLPIEEDITYNINAKLEVIETPGAEDENYKSIQGYMQPGAETINLYLNREPRFYANLGVTGGFWRSHGVRINTMFFANSDGGFNSSINATDFLPSGIGVQKLVHPESKSGGWQRVIKYPLPILRLADLYLMKAEAINEYYGPNEEAYEMVNKVRRRAGIPEVQEVWSDAGLARTVNRHITQDGFRSIIQEERANEFAFEGITFWDAVRTKNAVNRFSSPLWGWNHRGVTAKDFFVLEVKQQRRFTITDHLWPIDLNEMNTNSLLDQSPGWIVGN